MTGRIVNMVTEKGFFFLRVESDGAKAVDYFVHLSALRGVRIDELRENDEMEFEPDLSAPKGPRAEEVRRPGSDGVVEL